MTLQPFFRAVFVGLFLIIPLGVVLIWFFIVGWHNDPKGQSFSSGRNAIWLDHQWVDTPYSEETLERLGQLLTDHEIRYVYLHTGPIDSDGSVLQTLYPEAFSFLNFMKSRFPNLEWYTWLGQKRSQIDLDDPHVRSQIVQAGQALIEEIGFEGIHYDIEPIRAEDDGFISLLRETRLMLPETPLSVAADEWQPKALSQWLANRLGISIVSYWSTDQFKEVMGFVDQVVIMGYDTSLATEEWYRWFLEQQVIYGSKIAKEMQTPLLIGLPAYNHGDAQTFHPEVENIENGLHGVTQGLSNIRSDSEWVWGVALYPYWEMDEAEWASVDELWLKN